MNDGAFELVGQTEQQKATKKPKFEHRFVLDALGPSEEDRSFRVAIYDSADASTAQEEDFLGYVDFNLRPLLSKDPRELKLRFLNGAGKKEKNCSLTILAEGVLEEEQKGKASPLSLRCECLGLRPVAGACNPLLSLSVKDVGSSSFKEIAQSEKVSFPFLLRA